MCRSCVARARTSPRPGTAPAALPVRAGCAGCLGAGTALSRSKLGGGSARGSCASHQRGWSGGVRARPLLFVGVVTRLNTHPVQVLVRGKHRCSPLAALRSFCLRRPACCRPAAPARWGGNQPVRAGPAGLTSAEGPKWARAIGEAHGHLARSCDAQQARDLA